MLRDVKMLRKQGKQQGQDSSSDLRLLCSNHSLSIFPKLTSFEAWPGPHLCKLWFSHLQTGASDTTSGVFHQDF